MARKRDLTRLDLRRTILVTLPFMGALTFWQAYDGLIPLMLKNTFGMGDTVTGFFMALDNILALFVLPLVGSLSDRTHTRWGRRTPYIVAGASVAAVLTPLIALANRWQNLPLFLTALLAVLVALSVYRSPSVALMPDVTPRPLRSKADALNSLMAAVGGVVVLVGISVLVPEEKNPDYVPIYLVIAGMLAATTVAFAALFHEPAEVAAMHAESLELGIDEDAETAAAARSQERETDPERRRSLAGVLLVVFFWYLSNNAVTSGISRYAEAMWGMQGGAYAQVQTVATVAALVAYMPMANLSLRVGRKRTTYVGLALMVVGCVTIRAVGGFSPVIYALSAVFGVGVATVSLTVYPMVMELATEKSTGRYTGYYYTVSMAAQILTPILSGALMQFVGYEQLYVYAAACAALGFVPLAFVRHGDTMTLDEVARRQREVEDGDKGD